MVPEIWSATDKIFLSSWAIFCPFTPLAAQIMKISKMKKRLEISSFYTSAPKIMVIGYNVPEIWHVMDVIVIFNTFPFYSPITAQQMKTNPGDIVILHKCTKNHDHMLYCSWDMAREGCNYFSLSAFFLPFYPPNNPKNQNLKKKKKRPGDIII